MSLDQFLGEVFDATSNTPIQVSARVRGHELTDLAPGAMPDWRDLGSVGVIALSKLTYIFEYLGVGIYVGSLKLIEATKNRARSITK